jgi:Holliday junction resolvase RusA-like endonuclease
MPESKEEPVSLRFDVPGIPAPQGSKNAWGQEDNPRTKPWRAAVAARASEAMAGQPLLTGALQLDVVFEFPRPKSHYGTGGNSGRLKASAPRFHTARPDADKLTRAIGDALTGIVYRDDSQIARLNVAKLYAETASAGIFVQCLDDSNPRSRTRQEATN